jgi:hypothetical protein
VEKIVLIVREIKKFVYNADLGTRLEMENVTALKILSFRTRLKNAKLPARINSMATLLPENAKIATPPALPAIQAIRA